MKKIILALALAAFIGGGTLVFATSNTNSEIAIQLQDGKKKATAKKSTNKDACKSECSKDKKSASCKDKKSECSGESILDKKSCCSDGTNAKKKTVSPEKK